MQFPKLFVIINGFVHDFAAGIWLALVVAIRLLHNAHTTHPEIRVVLNGIERQFFWASIVAVIMVFATGAGRTFTYMDNWYGADKEQTRRLALLIKHVVLLVVFSAGIWFAWYCSFH